MGPLLAAGAGTLTPRQILLSVLMKQLLGIFLAVPAIVPALIASYSVVGEKQLRTLEPVLATPVRVRDLLAGKCLAALLPALAATWTTFGVTCALLRSVLPPEALAVAPPNAEWLIAVLLVAPLLAFGANTLTVLVSARVRDPRAAHQFASLLVLPIIGAGVLQLARGILLGWRFWLGTAVVMLWVDAILAAARVALVSPRGDSREIRVNRLAWSMLARLIAALSDAQRRMLLAAAGAYRIGAPPDDVMRALGALGPDALVAAAQTDAAVLAALWPAALAAVPCAVVRYPGRAEALLAVARALGRPLPAAEYALPEDALESLVDRARRARGQKLVVRGAPGHKGRVGDAVERLLVGARAPARPERSAGRAARLADHAAAEIKSVPVSGDRVVERVKLGVVSARSNPLAKCDRVLFVFVEQRGADYFIRDHRVVDFDRERWRAMWDRGFLVETAAGSPRHPARGLYLTPGWFRHERMWPPA
jgi:hypothetical protein